MTATFARICKRFRNRRPRTDEILPEDLPDSLLERAQPRVPPGSATEDLQAIVVEAKRRAVLAAFHKAGRNYTQAAKLLGVHPNYLHRLIRNLDMKTELEKRWSECHSTRAIRSVRT
jgi:DNA-binding PucR family transcriptional regulator